MANLKIGKTIGPCIRGDNRTINCTYYESDGTTPINLTGGTAYFTVQTSSDPTNDSSVILQKTATSFTSPSTGQHSFELSATDMEIDAGEYWYDTEFVDSTGSKVSSWRGKFILQSDITRT